MSQMTLVPGFVGAGHIYVIQHIKRGRELVGKLKFMKVLPFQCYVLFCHDIWYLRHHDICSFTKSLKGVLYPSTKISMFCLFSPSSRGKLILFMYGCDRCVWFKVKKHDIFSMDLRISHVERFKIFFSLFNLRNHFKINGINLCFYYS